MSGWRHESLGAEIDRSRPLRFTFDGRKMEGFAGDTIASALLANGVRVVGRSFKYHRPRGIWGMGGEEQNAIFDVTLGGVTTPNQRGTLVALRDGMEVRSVNAAPNAARDRFGLMDLAHRFLPAGFYYKTFMALGWMRWEPMIRDLAGLGRLDPRNEPPADIATRHAVVDLLVVGAGPGGLAAARSAASAGRKVWLVDEARALGGSLRWRGGEIDGTPWADFVSETVAQVEAAGGRVLRDTTVWGMFDHGLVAAWERSTGPDVSWHLRVTDIIVAAGALERPLCFANNDLPGVLSAEAALAHLNLNGAVAGREIVLGTANDASHAAARALVDAGAAVRVVDARPDAPDIPGARMHKGETISSAKGRKEVFGVTIGDRFVTADTVLVSGGYTPSVHLHCQAGGKLDYDAAKDILVPRPGTAPVTVVGAANGTMGLQAALAEGHAAGGGTGDGPRVTEAADWNILPLHPDPTLKGRQWVDLQNDVTLKDVALAAREGYTSVEHLKRYTTLGMATDQGRTANFGGLAAMAALTGRSIPETGTTTYRPPFTPVPLPVIAGRRRGELFNPPKRLALEAQHLDAGAKFREYGGWLRPSVYGQGNEATVAQAEAKAACDTVGIYDASPLGKLEVIGPAAAKLVDFTNYRRMSTLKPGMARYGFTLSETGVVYDDGVVFRLAEDRFIVSASSSHVDGVRFAMEDARQDRIGRGKVHIHDVTAAWVTLSLTGPKARALCDAAQIPLPDLPFMGVAETDLDGIPLRVARVSFTGDLSFELSVPAPHADVLHARIDAARGMVDGHWIGLEAVMILRAEKGFILIGKDTDGVTLPMDLGWEGPKRARTDEYLGKRSLFTEAAEAPDRKTLVGLTLPPGDKPLVTGSHLVPLTGPRRSLGFVTSSYFSPNLNRPIALALLECGTARMGEAIGCFHDRAVRKATVGPACAFDPEGARLDG
ncbi:MAG: 2Fe-2S iron-sulfur cluster-binding protein [Pseudomonadota bacterium]